MHTENYSNMATQKYVFRGSPTTMFDKIVDHPMKNNTAKILLINILKQRVSFEFTILWGMQVTKNNNNAVLNALKILEKNGFLSRIKLGRNKVEYYWFESSQFKEEFMSGISTHKRLKPNSIHNEDCLHTMSRMKSNLLDMVLTSPPYDNLRTYQDSSYSFPFQQIALELYRVMKPGGVVVWIVGDSIINKSESLTSFRQALYFRELGFLVHDTMIYNKQYFKHNSRNRYFCTFEYMFVLTKDYPPKTANLLADRKNKTAGAKMGGTQRTKDGRIIPKSGSGKVIQEYGYRGNIWSYSTGLNNSTKDKYAFEHPAILPEKLVSDHILTWSNPGDLIYDPFGGSGTTGKIAKLLGRRYMMSELVNEYIPLMKKRVKVSPL